MKLKATTLTDILHHDTYLFAWLLTLHPDAAARVNPAYGGLYWTESVLWL